MSLNRSKTVSTLPKPIDEFKTRQLRWLWYYLNFHEKIYPRESITAICKQLIQPSNSTRLDTASTFEEASVDLYKSYIDSRCIRIMDTAIRNDKDPEELVNRIVNDCRDNLVPEEYLKWIDKKNHRLLIWCLNNIHRPFPDEFDTSLKLPKRQMQPPNRNNFRVMPHEEIITMIDIWPVNSQMKINYLSEKNKEWANYKTPDKQIKWIKQDDEVQLVWAWEYLESHRKDFIRSKPANMTEYYIAILASLDEMSYRYHPAEKQIFIDQMKKTWSQKKYRDSGKAKKPYYLPLTIKTREKLDWLSENSGRKPTDILEQLIEESYSIAQKK